MTAAYAPESWDGLALAVVTAAVRAARTVVLSPPPVVGACTGIGRRSRASFAVPVEQGGYLGFGRPRPGRR
jgi:hypothetical protein